MDHSRTIAMAGTAIDMLVRGLSDIHASRFDHAEHHLRSANNCARKACEEAGFYFVPEMRMGALADAVAETTSYCNHGHVLSNGKPVDHECYVLPAAAVRAEHQGNIQLAQQLIAEAKPLKHHNGVRRRDVGRAHKVGAKDWVAYRTDNSHSKAADWVAQLPGDGGVDWGYTWNSQARLLMTFAQATRFKVYMRRLGKEQHIVIIQLSAAISWRPEMFIPGDGWVPNGQRFATEQEALDSASDLHRRWTQPTGYRAMPSRELVNYKREDGKDVRIDAIGQIYG